MSVASSASFSPVSLPMRRSGPFDPPAEYRCLREEEPVSRLAFPDGKVGWLLTRHQDVRALLRQASAAKGSCWRASRIGS
jgi:cytochrome P450